MQSQALAAQITAWQAGIDYEVGFWDRWFETKGLEWPEDYSAHPDPDRPFPKGLLAPRALSQHKLRVLDVGDGPMTILGQHIEGHTVEITVCDPLAHMYSRIACRVPNGILPY
jgi:hypothetical protein